MTPDEIIALCPYRAPGVVSPSHPELHGGWPCPYQRIGYMLDGLEDTNYQVDEWRLDLPFVKGKPPLSLNDRGMHWGAHAKLVDLCKRLTRQAVMDAGIPHLDHVHVELHWRPPTNAHRDQDNPVGTMKPCIDALHQAAPDVTGWVPILDGDDPRYVSWSPPTLHRANKSDGPATWLILRSV